MDENRNKRGQFKKGNNAGKGRPIGSKVDALRRALIDAVKPKDMKEIINVLIVQAKAGDIQAAKVIFERTLGQPLQVDLIERLEELEHFISQLEESDI